MGLQKISNQKLCFERLPVWRYNGIESVHSSCTTDYTVLCVIFLGKYTCSRYSLKLGFEY